MNIKQLIQKIQPKRFSRLWKWAMLAIGSLIFLVFVGYMTILYGGRLIVDESKLIYPEKTVIMSEDGTVIKELYEERRRNIDIGQLPDHVKHAFVAIEDRRFYDHSGVDSKSVARALIKDIISRSKKEGASTITQQVAKNVFLSNEKTWLRKAKEIMAASYLEKNYSKDEILAMYMNYVYFGEGAYGIEEAAQTYFDKHAQELDVAEAALLAGMVQRPADYNPFTAAEKALQRRNVVLKAMESAQYLSAKERLKLSREALHVSKREHIGEAAYDSYIDLVLKEASKHHKLSIEELKRGGYDLTVYLDQDFQKIAYEFLQDDSYYSASNEDVESSFVAIEGETGYVRAAVGGRDYQLGNLNRVTTNRQPGSTLKPLAVYGPALMKKYEPYSLLNDSLETYGDYTPENYDGQYAGKISLYESLMYSKNASTIWLLNEIGIPYSQTFLDKMHIKTDDRGLAIGLGGLSDGISPLDLANGYRTLLDEGIYTDYKVIQTIKHSGDESLYKAKASKGEEVFSPQTSWQLTEILQETARSGTAKNGQFDGPIALKTGTTEHPFVTGQAKDAWVAGYTPAYSFSLWIGYDTTSETNYLTRGSDQATVLVKEMLTEYEKITPLDKKFKRPSGVNPVEKPIQMSTITKLDGAYELGFPLAKTTLSWEADQSSNRLEYHVYEVTGDKDKRIGKTVGKTKFTIANVNPFVKKRYYVVPYNPLTDEEGKPSPEVEISF